jgi:hypothetical protein
MLKDVLLVIATFAGIGAFIDFLIGKVGQEKVKTLLFEWWVRFDDVQWKDFGKQEGLFAAHCIERWFGKNIWNHRRLGTGLFIFLLLLFIGFSLSITPDRFPQVWYYEEAPFYFGIIALILTIIGFSISVSFTIITSYQMAYLAGVGKLRNLLIFITMLIINYLILKFWISITSGIRSVFLTEFVDTLFGPESFEDFVSALWSSCLDNFSEELHKLYPIRVIRDFAELEFIDLFAFATLPSIPSLFRFALSLVFVGSFLLKPLMMRPISYVWARIVESDKPVFTLVFGFAGACAKIISEVAQRMSG